MQSLALTEALTEFIEAAGAHLRAEVESGAEIPFELAASSGRRAAGPSLYAYRPLTDAFLAERLIALERLPSHARAARALRDFDGLDRYIAAAGRDPAQLRGPARVRTAVELLLAEVFAEQSDFLVHPQRVRRAIERLERSALASAGGVTIAASLHGMTITSAELALTRGLAIARPETLQGLPEALQAPGDEAPSHLVATFACEQEDLREALAHGRAVLLELLRGLRLFGDGRVTLGAVAWARVAGAAWTPVPLGAGGRPRGMLVVGADQEDELRAFCNLVSRRAPHRNEVAWALRRFELGCDRAVEYEALSDHLLALRALLEPEGPASGRLPERLAALCALAPQRPRLRERVAAALALERDFMSGAAVEHAAGLELAREIADHLRALLRDVICGHLETELAALADDILLEDEPQPAVSEPAPADPSEPLTAQPRHAARLAAAPARQGAYAPREPDGEDARWDAQLAPVADEAPWDPEVDEVPWDHEAGEADWEPAAEEPQWEPQAGAELEPQPARPGRTAGGSRPRERGYPVPPAGGSPGAAPVRARRISGEEPPADRVEPDEILDFSV